MRFEWDSDKAAANLAKHKVSFEEACTVFGDLLAVTIDDPDGSADENRLLTKGLSTDWKLLVVGHMYEEGVSLADTIKNFFEVIHERKHRF